MVLRSGKLDGPPGLEAATTRPSVVISGELLLGKPMVFYTLPTAEMGRELAHLTE